MNNIIFRIAWRNIWRNSRRTAITLVMMSLSVGLMVWMIGLGDGFHEEVIRSSLTTGLGSIQIHAEGYQEDKGVADAILDPDPVIEIARLTPGIEGISVRLTAFGLVSHSNESQGAMIIGVDPVGETTISTIQEKVGAGEWFPSAGDEPEEDRERGEHVRRLIPTVIGNGVAAKLDVDLGDRVFLTAQGFTRDAGYANCTVVGIFRTGMVEIDKNAMYVPIDDLRTVMGSDIIMNDDGSYRFENAVHEVTILLEKNIDLHGTTEALRETISAGASEDLEVMSWEDISPGLRKFIDLDEKSIYVFMLILFLIVAIGVMNTFLMSVFERIREFGILMSLGTRPASIFNLVLSESIMIGFLGGFGGLIIGLLAIWVNYVYPWSLDSYGDMNEIMSMDWTIQMRPILVWANVLKAIVGIMFFAILAAAWPAWVARNLKPVEALRHV